MFFAITEAFSSIRDFMEAGGSVLWLIAILVFFMWAMIFERIWYFSHGHEFYIQDLSAKWNNRSDKTSWHALQIREKMLSQAKVEINKNLSIIQTCVVLAPLFGLLGTVTGMIEVFQVMAFNGGVTLEQWREVFLRQHCQQWLVWLLLYQAYLPPYI